MHVIDTPEGIAAFRLLSLRGRLSLEISGLRFKGRATSTIIKQEFPQITSRNREVILREFDAILREKGILR